jgi:hypothetical protein
VNASFNGKNQPLVENPLQAIDFVLTYSDLDGILLQNLSIRRAAAPDWTQIHLAPEVLVTTFMMRRVRRPILARGPLSMEVPESAMGMLEPLRIEGVSPLSAAPDFQAERAHAVFNRFLKT